MSAAKNQPKIFNIPSGSPFARALAAQLIKETKDRPEILAAYRILLPTRRATRVMREAFLQETGGKPLLLPRLQSLGDVDEEELSLVAAGEKEIEGLLALPPAMPRLRRQLLLAKTISAIPGHARSHGQSLALAAALGRLMDQIYTEGLDFSNLAALVPAEFAGHWQVTIKFLEIISEKWPEILAEEGAIDYADHRNRLIRGLSAHWRAQPPQTPVIAAGSTGSIPATAELLQVISILPQGRVILPGLDTGMDAESWDNLEEAHPQFGLRHLLQSMDTSRCNVETWSGCEEAGTPRDILASELMRPAAASAAWMDLGKNAAAQTALSAALQGLRLMPCENEQEEAKVIALTLRETLETPGKTAALITSDRALARRVAAALARWDIPIDDSAGLPLGSTPAGSFLRLVIEACCTDFAPVALLALLKHTLCSAGNLDKSALSELDIALRGPRPAPGLDGLKTRLEENQAPRALGLIRSIEPFLTRFMSGSDLKKIHIFNEIIKAHLQLAENLSGPEILWRGEDGEAASAFFAQLMAQGGLLPETNLHGYREIIENLLKSATPVRPAYGTHPRLKILGQIEARLTDADLVIMGGLCEGTWPPDPGHDPWMSRPMRKQFGLPAAERKIGLAAHDFVQGFCAPEAVLTYPKRKDGAPAVPARWLLRLETVLKAAGLDPAAIYDPRTLAWAHDIDRPAEIRAIKRPEPRPPVDRRPRELSVTRIETLMKDPYGIYAEYILRLRKHDPLEKPIDAAEKGNLLHTILKRFVDAHPATLPENAAAILTALSREELAKRHDDPAAWSFWEPRFARLADWYIGHEQDWRQNASKPQTERSGSIVMKTVAGPFTLKARADRIDRLHGGGAVIDYKSGGSFSLSGIKTGKLPQLSLEGLILAQGGFKDIDPLEPVFLGYWKMTGGADPGKVYGINVAVSDITANSQHGLRALLDTFSDEKTAYYSLPRPDNAPRFNDYEHLARIREWTALGESDDAGSEAA